MNVFSNVTLLSADGTSLDQGKSLLRAETTQFMSLTGNVPSALNCSGRAHFRRGLPNGQLRAALRVVVPVDRCGASPGRLKQFMA